MDFRQLKYFVQIADNNSFSRAAEVLRIAQPSLSQQMKNLEQELGAELLVRHARGVALTEKGQQLYDHAMRIIREVERARDVVRSDTASPHGRVTVGLPTSAARGLSLPLVRAVREAHPRVTIHLIEAMTAVLDEYLQQGRLDVCLLYNHKAFENVAWTEMIAEDLMAIVAPGHPLAARDSVTMAELAAHPLVLPGSPNVLRTVMERSAALCDQHLQGVDCDSLPAIGRMVCEEGAICVMPHFAFSRELERGEMRAVPILDPTPSWRLSVVVSQRSMNIRGAEAVAQILAGVISSMVDAGAWRARLLAR